MAFLMIDNFDSFTYNLADYILQCGVECCIVRNDTSLDEIQQQTYQGLILSPGPETPHKAGNLMQIIDRYVHTLPVLGICLGHQALGEYFGAELGRADKPKHGKLSYMHCQPDVLFEDMPTEVEVVRYHSLILRNMPASLEILAWTVEKEIMAFRHKSLPVRGMQFHPEAALTQYGLKMINNWLNFAKICSPTTICA